MPTRALHCTFAADQCTGRVQYKVRFNSPHGLPITPSRKGKKGKEDDEEEGVSSSGKIVLGFKKFLFHSEKAITQ